MHIRIMRRRYTTGPSLDFIKAAECFVEQVQPLFPESYQPDRTGPCRATADPGAAASVSLWGDALQAGPGFVNPRDFPWTLANSPGSLLAGRFTLPGPRYMLTGRTNATLSTF